MSVIGLRISGTLVKHFTTCTCICLVLHGYIAFHKVTTHVLVNCTEIVCIGCMVVFPFNSTHSISVHIVKDDEAIYLEKQVAKRLAKMRALDWDCKFRWLLICT